MFQYAGKGYNLTVLALVVAVVYALVIGVESGRYPLQGPVLLGFANGDSYQVESIVYLEFLIAFLLLCPKGKEMGLCVTEGDFHLAHLQYLVRMIGADSQADSTVHNVFTQSHCQRYSTLFGFLISNGVVVDAACYTAYDGIETISVLFANHFLQDNSHLFLIDDIAGGRHVVLASLIEYAGVDSFYGSGKHGESFVLVCAVWNHVGRVYAGEGLVV